MHHHRLRFHVEIEIHFHPAHVRVGRHGVPYAPRLKFRQAHDELTAFGSSTVNEFVNRPLVRPLHRSKRGPIHIGMTDVRCRVRCMGGKRDEEKHGRLIGLCTRELDLLHPLSDVEHVFLCKPVFRTVDLHGSFSPHIHHTQFSPLGEIVCSHLFLRCKQLHRSCRGNNAPHDRTICIAIDHRESPGCKKFLDDKRCAQFFCR